MLYLMISMVGSSMISIVMRLSQSKIHAKTSMLAMNYVTCMFCASMFTGVGNLFPRADGADFTLTLGVINGAVYVASLMLTQYNVRKNGVVLPSVFSKIGALLVPMAVAIMFFSERPGVPQIVGAALAIAAIIVMNFEGKRDEVGSMASLLMLFAIDGVVGTTAKIYGELGSGDLFSHFLLYTFGTAFFLCAAITLFNREKPGLWEVLFGIMLGVPNYFSSHFLLLALKQVPAIIAYPVRSVGSILVIALTGVLLFREKLRKTQWIAIAAIIAAVALLNL